MGFVLQKVFVEVKYLCVCVSLRREYVYMHACREILKKMQR